MIALTVRAIGLLAPGLAGWQASLPVLRGEAPYRPAADLPPLKPALLPPGERRRATAVIRLALAAADDALATVDPPVMPSGLSSVFASSSGDLETFDRICRALQDADRPVSPTHFHNSVHNAPAGYWAIAASSTHSSTSLSAYDGSFAAGLLETASIVAGDGAPVLLVAYDAPAPQPLAAKRPISVAFAVALLCTPISADSCIARLAVSTAAADQESGLADTDLERLRRGNPAARSLPLLWAIARGTASTITLPAATGLIRVEVGA